MTGSTLIVVKRSPGWTLFVPYDHSSAVYGGPPQPTGPRGTAIELQVLAGVGDRVDRPAGLGTLLALDQGPDVDDALALLTGDARPVVGVGGVGQVLVLAELVHA